MAKKRQEGESAPAKPPRKQPSGSSLPWHPLWRCLVSLLVLLHLAAIFSAPWDLATQAALPPGYVLPTDARGQLQTPRPEDPIWQQPVVPRWLRGFFRRYLNLAYINHGYEFFAPDPAGSHLIRYRIWDSGGQEIVSGELPSHDDHWPRLYYHRHLMLAAQTGDMGEESGRRFAQHLLRVHGGKTIRLEWIYHKLLSPQQVANEQQPDAASNYVVLATIQETARESSGGNEAPVSIPGARR